MAFRIPSNRTLGKIVVYGAVTCISAVMYMRYSITNRIRNQEYFREAFKTLRSHEGAVNLLGEPIKEMGFNLSDAKRNFCDGQSAKFDVAVKGSKERGRIYFTAEREDGAWQLKTLELTLKSRPDMRLLVKKEES